MGFFYLYYALGLPAFLSITIALYLLFTGARKTHPPFLIKGTEFVELGGQFFVFALWVAQALERRSTSAGSSKRRAHTCGHRRA